MCHCQYWPAFASLAALPIMLVVHFAISRVRHTWQIGYNSVALRRRTFWYAAFRYTPKRNSGRHTQQHGTSHTAIRAASYNPSHCLKLNGVNSMPLNSMAPIAESTRCPPTWSNFVAGTQDLATESCKGCGV